MQIYTVYLKKVEPVSDFILVKEGFCWPGFFLSALWALGRGLWLVAFALLIVNLLASVGSSMLGLSQLGQGAVSLGLAVAVGFVANDLRRWTLERRGYVIEGVVSGLDGEAAERRFLEKSPALATELLADVNS